MTQKVKVAIGTAAFILLIAWAGLAYNSLRERFSPETSISTPTPQEDSGTSSEPEKMKAPDFTVEDSDGNKVKLSDMVGKPVVLNFWASWCPPCIAEMPEFDSVYAELGKNITFMMVDLTDGQRETKEKGEKFVSDQGFSFPVYFDTEQDAAYTYGIRSIPTTIFIDKDGYIVTGAEGQLNEDSLRYGISLIQNEESDIVAEYRKISAKEAYEMMAETNNFILLDVRTDEEYNEKKIADAILIPDYEIADRAETELTDKHAIILVYCRTGRRSANAANELVSMGYTNVYDFGGINNWPYETN